MSQQSNIVAGIADAAGLWMKPSYEPRIRAIEATLTCSNTFTPEALEASIDTIMSGIRRDTIDLWISERITRHAVPVAVLNAGNVPFVGLQDLLAVVCTGHEYVGVLSSKSPHLLPAFTSTVEELSGSLPVSFVDFDSALRKCGALIATGSDATVTEISSGAARAGLDRGCMLLRGTRISVAVMDGSERIDQLDALAGDALLHEGRGCLNVCIIFAPDDLDWNPLLRSIERFRTRFPPHRTTLDSVRQEVRLFRATGQRHHEGAGVVLVDGEPEPGPPGVVVWSRYSTIRDVERWIGANAPRLQTVVTTSRSDLQSSGVGICLAGESQDPRLDWMPDRKDTIEFLVGI